MTIEQLQAKGLANFNKQFAIFQKHKDKTVDQLFQMKEIIELKKEMEEIKRQLAQLQ